MPAPLSPEPIAALRASANLHLTAVDFYRQGSVAHARLGYAKLGARWATDREEEEGHLRLVLDRLAFFWEGPSPESDDATFVEPGAASTAAPGAPEASQQSAPRWASVPRDDVPSYLAAALDMERAAAAVERQGILAARAHGDEGTAAVFTALLAGSEESILRIEGDLTLLEGDQVGADNWLANQI